MSRLHLISRLVVPAGLLVAAAGGRAAGQATMAPASGSQAAPAATRPTTSGGSAAATSPAVSTTVPASSPTTGPASRGADSRPAGTRPAYSLDSPRDALKWFAAGLRDGDAGRLRQVVLTTSPAEDRMVTAIGDMARAFARLHAAAAGRFGPEAAGRFTDGTAAQFEQTLARIDAAEVAIDGDAATVRYAESTDRPYALKRVGSAWRLPAAQFSQGASAEALDRQMAELVVQARIVNEMAGEIAAGRYKTADAAGQAWRSRMMSALGGQGPGRGGTGQPGTVPATSPAVPANGTSATTKPRD